MDTHLQGGMSCLFLCACFFGFFPFFCLVKAVY